MLFKLRVVGTLYSRRETFRRVHLSLEESYPSVVSKDALYFSQYFRTPFRF